MYPFFDSSFVIIIPAILLGLWAQYKVSSTFKHYSQIETQTGKTAATVAREILDSYGLNHVPIERVEGHLSDHFDPSANVVRLSESVHDSKSIASIGVAAHEVGHAVQHAEKYRPIAFRNALVPAVNIVNYSWFFIIIAGFFLHSSLFIKLGIAAYSIIALFQLITLPVEFDASARALKVLKHNYFTPEEFNGAKSVLRAAGFTYVAALVSSLSEILRLVLLFNSSNNDD